VCERAPVARALGLDVADIDGGLPVQQARAGVAALLVPLRSLGALRRASLDLAAFAPLAAAGFAPLVYLFCREPRDAHKDLAVRFFFEAHGVREDPATGNGAAFLGAYLLEHRDALAARDTIRIEQGHEVGRPSTVLLRARERDGAREIRVGGAVIATLCGEVL
jgi:trans-2,3-dihydro-3-hydroxyanthranilate isomerase